MRLITDHMPLVQELGLKVMQRQERRQLAIEFELHSKSQRHGQSERR